MSRSVRTRRQFGEGPLAGPAAFVYTLLTVELMVLIATLPGLVPLALLGSDASNLPLAAACAIPLGPALSAALYALHHRRGDLTELEPVAAFWRGYRRNLRDVLWVWLPALLWLTVVAVNLTNFVNASVPGWWAALLAVVGVGVTLWLANALVIASLFAFRPRDTAKLAAYYLGHTPGVTLGNACLLIVAGAIIVLLSEVVLVLLVPVLLLSLLRTAQPMITQIRENFTVPEESTA